MAETTETPTFLTALADLATHLSAAGVEIHSVTYDCHGFGRWELEAGRRRVRVRVSWDGKDRQLRIATAELASGSKERRWRTVEEHDFRQRRTELVPLFATIRAAIRAHAGL